jgi:ATP-dependent DNA helicase RecQ
MARTKTTSQGKKRAAAAKPATKKKTATPVAKAKAKPRPKARTVSARAEPSPEPLAGPPEKAPGPRKKRVTLPALVEIGRTTLGIEELRPGQPEALKEILAGRDVLAVMPTGSGKSLLYQLPSLVLPGLTVVVSPLIALITDQVEKMRERGVAVARVDSTLTVRQKRAML